jgi:WD40 repeat protein
LTTGHEPLIRLWDAATGKPVLHWPAHTDGVQALAFLPDGRSLVSGSLDGTVRLWEVTTGRQLRKLAGHRWRCDVVAVAPNGRVILSGGADGCIRLSDQDGKPLGRMLLDGPPEERSNPIHHVLALGVLPNSKTATTWSRDPNKGPPVYHLWDLATGKALSSRPDTSLGGNIPQISPDGQQVLEYLYENRAEGAAPAAGAGGVGMPGPIQVGVLLRDLATGREILRLRHPDGYAGLQAFAADGRTLATVTSRQEQKGEGGRYDNTLHLWERATGKERLTIACGWSAHWIRHIAYAADGRTLASAWSDGRIQLWELSTGKELGDRPGSDTEVSCLAFSPDSRVLASAHRDGTILVWDAASAASGKGRSAEKPDSPQLERWWADLARADARRAYAAVCGLSTAPALRWFRDRLHPTTEAPLDLVQPLIADLDSPEFQRREAAMKQLTALNDRAGPALRAALKASPAPEQRRRIEALLASLDGVPSGEALRHLRAVEVLERIGNGEARALLETLAKGAADARLTREAQATLKRFRAGSGRGQSP